MIGHPLREDDSFGRTTDRFFAEGEEHEAHGWGDVDLPFDDEAEPKRRLGGEPIDKIPRQRSAVFALVVFAVLLAAGAVIGGLALFGKDSRLAGVTATIRSWVHGSPAKTSAEPPAAPPQNQARPEAPPASQVNAEALGARAPVQLPAQPEPAVAPPASKKLPVPSPASTRTHGPEKTAVLPDIEGQERLRKDAEAVRRRRHRSEDNYVWSPQLHALVPASSLPVLEQP
jgi:hypothetical protein